MVLTLVGYLMIKLVIIYIYIYMCVCVYVCDLLTNCL